MSDLHEKLAKLSPEKRALFLKKLAQSKSDKVLQGIPCVARDKDNYPLSLVQQSYWFFDQLDSGSSLYNTGGGFKIEGDIDVAVFKRALDYLVERHECLRTNIVAVGGKPRQVVHKEVSLELPYEEMLSLGSDSEELLTLVREEVNRAFDLASDVLIRVKLLKVDEKTYVFVLTVHHIVFDGWSVGLLLSELLKVYSAFKEGQDAKLSMLPIQYIDYAVWQEEWTRSTAFENEISFWRDNLDGASPFLKMPTDYNRPAVQSYKGASSTILISFDTIDGLNEIGRKNGATLFMVMLAALNILLSRFANETDISIGTAVANRNRPELESLIGFFANTIVLRNKVELQDSFIDFLANIKKSTTLAFNHATVPFDMVVDAVQPERSLGVPPVFQINFILQNAHDHSMEENTSDLKMQGMAMGSQTAKLDLNLFVFDSPDGYVASLEYATDLFTEKTIKRILSSYKLLLENIVKNPEQKNGYYPLVADEERARIERWNDTDKDFPWKGGVHNLFEMQVEKTPDKLAYVFENREYSYKALNEEANKLANFLINLGVGPEVRVGLSVNRSHWLGIATLAIFKSGGTYVPLNPSYPDERLNHMVEDTAPSIILTQQALEQHFLGVDAKVIGLEEISERLNLFSHSNPPVLSEMAQSAYILYTSGSTGKPKGILISHGSFRNMALAHQWAGLLDENNRVLQFASMSFSISLWSSFMAWFTGATLYQVNDDQSMPGEALYALLEKKQITIATWPVSLLAVLPVERMPASLKTVVSSAEPCNETVARKWSSGGRKFLNMYGNSEVSLGSSLYEHKEGVPFTIGKPFPNTKLYLLDSNLKQVPVGVLAEIHTSGIGLAKGYINRPDATAENFIPNHMGSGESNRLYRTGDLGRYLPNGEIEFHGRNDFQVSIRGYRIETSEIEKIISERDEVDDVAVVARPDPQSVDRLVGFVVAKEEGVELDFKDIRNQLSRTLPNFMVPSVLQQLEAMPLTPNRKVDRLGLPTPDLSAQLEKEYSPPQNEIEERLAHIWENLLGLEKIGTQSHFFELGGHSLLATQLVSRIQEVFDIHLPVRLVFEYPTICELAERVIELQELNTQPVFEEDEDGDEFMELKI